jgi:hypothetical protein
MMSLAVAARGKRVEHHRNTPAQIATLERNGPEIDPEGLRPVWD